MKFRIKLSRKTLKFINKHRSEVDAIEKIFSRIAKNPYDRELDIKKLIGLENDYRLRWGRYRFLYTVLKDEGIILIYNADTRGDVYK